jgi:hypothetical protein
MMCPSTMLGKNPQFSAWSAYAVPGIANLLIGAVALGLVTIEVVVVGS